MAHSLFLKELEVSCFRNIQEVQLSFDSQFNFFFGQNAQGKTSLLEAIYFLIELRSFRTSKVESLFPYFNSDFSPFLGGKISREEILYEVQVYLGGSVKKVLLDGKTPRPYRKLRRLFPLVLFTPDSIRLFRASPSTRREYFDSFFSLLSEKFASITEDYEKVLKQKVGLMDRLDFFSFGSLKEEWNVWNERLAFLGAELTRERAFWTEKMKDFFQGSFSILSDNEWKMEFFYNPYLTETLNFSHSSEDLYSLFIDEMKKREKEEIERRQVLVGPHRDDWKLTLGKADFKEEGSQGQHRVAVSALKLAQVHLLKENGLVPIGLFDDLLSELDVERVHKMMEVLSESECQIFLTSILPDKKNFRFFDGKFFELKNGKVFLE